MLDTEIVMQAWSNRLVVSMKLLNLLASGVASQQQINSARDEDNFYGIIIGGYRG